MNASSTGILQTRETLPDEMAGGDLGDARLNARRTQLLRVLERAPDKGFPEACGDAADTEALYRFLRNPRVSMDSVVAPHLTATAARCQALGEVLVIHDTTEMAFACEQPRRGLTPLGSHRQGFWWHTALAVSSEGLRAPLGLLSVAAFTRVAARGPKMPWRERFHSPQKESRRWTDGVTAVRTRLGDAVREIHVMDREGDSYELFAALAAARARWIIRLHYDRQITTPGAAAGLLSALRTQLPVICTEAVTIAPRRTENRVQRLSYPAREGRVAQVSFAASPITLHRPSDHRKTSLPATLSAHVIFGWEETPPPGEAAVDWWLLTTEPIDTVAQVRQIVSWYRTRWMIEEFFKCLKTGCAYEKRQLESMETLLIALALFAPVAWQLLVLRHLSRELPEGAATITLSRRQLTLLRATRAGRSLPPVPSIRDALLAVARLGGHLRQNGQPGWLVLARGIQTLRHMEAGWLAARGERSDQS